MILFRSEDGKNKALGIGLVSSKTFWLMVISRKKKRKRNGMVSMSALLWLPKKYLHFQGHFWCHWLLLCARRKAALWHPFPKGSSVKNAVLQDSMLGGSCSKVLRAMFPVMMKYFKQKMFITHERGKLSASKYWIKWN